MTLFQQFQGERVFVTGVTCATGSALCRYLVDAGARVTALVRDPDRALAHVRGVDVVTGSCDSPASYTDAIRECPYVFHIAGMRFAGALLRAVAGHSGLARMVLIGSTRVHYPDASLTVAERANKQTLLSEEERVTGSRLPWTILRPTMIFSPDDRSISRLARMVSTTRLFPMPGKGRTVKQPIAARDLADSILTASLADAAAQQAYDVPGPDITVRDIIDEIAAVAGRTVVKVPVPRWPVAVARGASRSLGLQSADALLSSYLRWYEDLHVSGDRALAAFGHSPAPFAVNYRRQVTGVAL